VSGLLLDTNACIRVLNGSSAAVAARLQATNPADVRLSAVVKAELLYGARKSGRVEANLRLLRRFFDPLVSLPFDDRCADEAGLIRLDLERSGRPVGPNDLLIAATARAHDLVLVTHNIREFGRVPGLRLDDWEAGASTNR
jgi:tRNA(fMet)-specific endonuclease VapC